MLTSFYHCSKGSTSDAFIACRLLAVLLVGAEVLAKEALAAGAAALGGGV